MISFSAGARWPARIDQPFRSFPGRGRAQVLGRAKAREISFFRAPPPAPSQRCSAEPPGARPGGSLATRRSPPGRAPGGAAAQKMPCVVAACRPPIPPLALGALACLFSFFLCPPQVGDLVLVGLESGLPCHSQEGLWVQESTINHHFSW